MITYTIFVTTQSIMEPCRIEAWAADGTDYYHARDMNAMLFAVFWDYVDYQDSPNNEGLECNPVLD